MRRSGLRLRLRGEARRISNQHRQLDQLYEIVREALEQDSVHSAAQAYWRFSDALEAHLALEESIHFPALRGLCPWLIDELVVLVSEHAVIREQSAAVRALLEAGDIELSAERLEVLADGISLHEVREEHVLASISDER